ncbi:MAG: transcription elongation factor GreB [Bacteriovoracaceae bacterium]|jgi:transcription elongation factor GreB
MKSDKNYITPKGLKRLFDEQEYLIKILRPETTKVVTWAASLGDRSENADYQYSKKKLREIDRRLRFLAKRIDSAVSVNPLEIQSEKVQFGATVTLENEEGETKVFSIVGIDETDTKKFYISWRSPIGSALIGKEKNDEVLVRTPLGEVEYSISHIEYKEIEMEDWKCD